MQVTDDRQAVVRHGSHDERPPQEQLTGTMRPMPFRDLISRHPAIRWCTFLGMAHDEESVAVRVGTAAEMLGVSVDTLRRWEEEGRLNVRRSSGRQRLVALDEITRLLAERRRTVTDRPIVAQSARNRFPGIVTRVEVDRVAAVVEVQAGPHRLVSLMTAEAVLELGLAVGDEAVCVVKSTNVVVEIPSPRETRS
jgi:molybdopterin-binding protein